MALAVASTSTVSTADADNLTLTKASGVQVGDLLIIIASGYSSSSITCSGFTEAIPVPLVIGGDTNERQCYLTLLYRIADASDVSASNYTIAKSGSDSLGNACMLRVTGWISGNPVFTSSQGTGSTYAIGYTIGNGSLSLPRPVSQLLIQAYTLNYTDSGGNSNLSAYTITSSDSNPTWTEIIDADSVVNSASDSAENHLAVAYAITSNTSTITAFEATIGGSVTGNIGGAYFLVVIAEPQNVTADVSHLAVTPTIESVTASQVNVALDVSHLAITPTIEGIPTRDNSSTQWTNQTKPANSVINNQNKP